MMEIITKNPKETQKIAKLFAKEILSMGDDREKALTIALDGDLGAGKTTFVQGLVSGFGIKEEVSSPTFLIMKKIELHKHNLRTTTRKSQSNFRNLYHLDCYRLKSGKDLSDLDIKEILSDKENVVLIEWAGNVKSVLPKNLIRIKFEYKGEKERSINFHWSK